MSRGKEGRRGGEGQRNESLSLLHERERKHAAWALWRHELPKYLIEAPRLIRAVEQAGWEEGNRRTMIDGLIAGQISMDIG